MAEIDIITLKKRLVAKTIWTGMLGYAGAYFWFGKNGPMIIMNKLVPGWFAIGRAIAMASYLAKVLDEYILAKIPDNPYAKWGQCLHCIKISIQYSNSLD